MAYSNIDEYLLELRQHLKVLPNKEAESIIEEIESHFLDEIHELTAENLPQEEALAQVLASFKSPHELSQEFLAEHLEKENIKPVTAILLNLGLSGLAFLALPILKSFDWAWIVLGGGLLIWGVIIFLIKKHWNHAEYSFIHSAQKSILFILFPASLLFFWLTNHTAGEIVTFALYYMLIYWLLLFMYYLFIRKVSKSL